MICDLEQFFQEKDIPYTEWEIEFNGLYYNLDTDFVISEILGTTFGERASIARNLAKLDFYGGDIVDYLYHLAKCRVKMLSYCERF